MRILVTGGAGFIGRHVVKSFLKDHTVTIFDDFSNSSRDKILSLEELGVKVVKGDITNQNEIDNATRDTDVVIHLAARISVSESVKNPSETFRVNVEGTRNVLAACEKNRVKKLVVASSAAVYGEGSQNKLTEESETNPISPYGESKLKMEEMIKEFVSNHDISCIILRFFNIYGVGQSPEYAGVITKFIKRITQNKPLEIFGDGMQTRDFVAIEDVVDAIYASITNDNSGTYNIASGKAITIKDLAETIISASGKKLEIKHTIPQKCDIMHSHADISLAKNNFGHNPKVELIEGIRQLLKS